MVEHVIAGPKIMTEQGVLTGASLLIKNGVIAEIFFAKGPAPTLTFPEQYYLVPGFIDMHIHGAHDYDVMDGTEEALFKISQILPREGTTAYLATTMTASTAEIEQALKNVYVYQQQYSQGAEIVGIHLEGPFLAKEKCGAQNAEFIVPPDLQQFEHWQTLAGRMIKCVTLAPELPESLSLIRHLKKNNIIASIGHTNATFAETMTAITCGCTHATHLFNAMRGIHQREPGVVTAALLSDFVTVEMIADGIHLHPSLIQLIVRMKPQDKMVLVTDAIRAKCLPDGTYDLAGKQVIVRNSIARLADGTLSGSVLKMNEALQNILRFTNVSLIEALRWITENPAKQLGIFHKKGSIAPGKDADLVVLDEQQNVVLTMCRGQVSA